MISTLAFFLFCTACVLQTVFLIKSRKPDPLSHFILLTASLLLLYYIINRSLEIKFFALTNIYESLVFFSFVIGILLFLYRVKYNNQSIPFISFGGTIVIIVLLAIASSPVIPDEIKRPVPALQSAWLILHVSFAFIGEAFFAVAFIAAIYYLCISDPDKKKEADRIVYTAIAIGYPIYTAGALIFGAVWAQYAWGRFWGWDVKETWALITWLTYTAYLHSRIIKKFRGKLSAVFAITGFAFTLFTLFGVNYLLSGLHSYS